MTKRTLLQLAKAVMTNPVVEVRQMPDREWVCRVTNFACCEGFELHGCSRRAVVANAARVLSCWSTSEEARLYP